MAAFNPVLTIGVVRLFRFTVVMFLLFLFQIATALFSIDPPHMPYPNLSKDHLKVENRLSFDDVKKPCQQTVIFLRRAINSGTGSVKDKIGIKHIYSLQIEPNTANNTGAGNFEPAAVQFAIAPRFYETGWFALFMLFSVALLIYCGVRLRVRRLEQSEKKLKGLLHRSSIELLKEKKKNQNQADEIKELEEAVKGFYEDLRYDFQLPLTLHIEPLERTPPEAPKIYAATNFPDQSTLTNCDADPFLQSVSAILEKKYSDPDFNVLSLANALNLSRSYMARKIKKKAGLTPGEFIKIYRMEKAYLLLKIGRLGSITEVAYAVGFKNLSYFSHTFREHFGETPSEFLEERVGT